METGLLKRDAIVADSHGLARTALRGLTAVESAVPHPVNEEGDGVVAVDEDSPSPAVEVAAGSAPNSVLGKVQLILESFGLDDSSLSLSEISRRTGVPKASVHRLAQELLRGGLLERQGTDYSLGMRLFEIGQRVPRGRILRHVARPYMDDLAHSTGEMVHLAIRDGGDLLYLEKLSPRGRDSEPSRTAGRLPLHCTATGRVLLAFGGRAVVQKVVAGPLERLTPYTVISPKLLLTELGRIRHLGYAVEREQTRLGYVSVGVPVYGPTSSVVAALSITAPTSRANPEHYRTLLNLVSRRIARILRSASDED